MLVNVTMERGECDLCERPCRLWLSVAGAFARLFRKSRSLWISVTGRVIEFNVAAYGPSTICGLVRSAVQCTLSRAAVNAG